MTHICDVLSQIMSLGVREMKKNPPLWSKGKLKAFLSWPYVPLGWTLSILDYVWFINDAPADTGRGVHSLADRSTYVCGRGKIKWQFRCFFPPSPFPRWHLAFISSPLALSVGFSWDTGLNIPTLVNLNYLTLSLFLSLAGWCKLVFNPVSAGVQLCCWIIVRSKH